MEINSSFNDNQIKRMYPIGHIMEQSGRLYEVTGYDMNKKYGEDTVNTVILKAVECEDSITFEDIEVLETALPYAVNAEMKELLDAGYSLPVVIKHLYMNTFDKQLLNTKGKVGLTPCELHGLSTQLNFDVRQSDGAVVNIVFTDNSTNEKIAMDFENEIKTNADFMKTIVREVIEPSSTNFADIVIDFTENDEKLIAGV